MCGKQISSLVAIVLSTCFNNQINTFQNASSKINRMLMEKPCGKFKGIYQAFTSRKIAATDGSSQSGSGASQAKMYLTSSRHYLFSTLRRLITMTNHADLI